MHVVFAHGLEGSPNGYKARALAARISALSRPDMRGQPLAARIDGLVAHARALPAGPYILAGSSYGGLASIFAAHALMADRAPAGLLLLAPAIVLPEAPNTDPAALALPAGLPCAIVHGTRDHLIDVADVHAFAARTGADLRITEDGHGLGGSLDAMFAALASLGAPTKPTPA